MTNPVRWFEIYVSDMTRSKKFYEATLATKLETLLNPGPGVTEMMTFPMDQDATGSGGALVKMKDGPVPGAGVIIYFASEDCNVEAKRAGINGGKIVKDKFSIGQHGFIAHVTDPRRQHDRPTFDEVMEPRKTADWDFKQGCLSQLRAGIPDPRFLAPLGCTHSYRC